MNWQTRWQQTWQQLALPAPAEAVLDDLLARYRESQRHYHTLQHLHECFTAFDVLQDEADHPGEIALALWFHDAVYDVHRHDNEARSAVLAADCLRDAGAAEASINRVTALILATRHHASMDDKNREDKDCAILLDCDLAILGAAPARFAEYERQVRNEYAHVPEPAFREGRARVLRTFLERPRIYLTARCLDQYEAQARRNIQGSLAG